LYRMVQIPWTTSAIYSPIQPHRINTASVR
jgi:hypothetical protein